MVLVHTDSGAGGIESVRAAGVLGIKKVDFMAC